LVITGGPAKGSASISGVTLTYFSGTTQAGADSVTYVANGPGGQSLPGTVSVNIIPPPPPAAGNATLTVDPGALGQVSLPVSGYYNTITITSGPSNGTASISGNTLSYTSNPGVSNTTDSVGYVATGAGGSTPATVSITVNPTPASVQAFVTDTSYDRLRSGTTWQPSTPASITCSASGGSGNYTYNWVRVSGDTATFTGNGATVGWTRDGPVTDATYTSVWQCQVTDNVNGQVGLSPNVSVTIEFSSNQ